ncbi:MAG: PepSY domain-containing protein [Ignavibacteria bacterium]|nr:PepSY domain-containing protein [Ignavibacteria bacterium]
MEEISQRQKQAKILRLFRKVHRTTGAILFIFFFFVSISGLLLGWKKNSGGLILPHTYEGTSTDLKEWLPLDSLHKIACKILHDSVSKDLSLDLERIDVRNDKGMVKFVFTDHYWGVQIDGATGNLLHIERRRSDIVENFHDGSILDYFFDTKHEQIKLVYTSVMGTALLTFTVTGFWLWFGTKRMRKKKHSSEKTE